MSNLSIMVKDTIIREFITRLKNLEERLHRLEAENVSLKKENAKLRELLAKYDTPKNSKNSSIPHQKTKTDLSEIKAYQNLQGRSLEDR